jgi:SAM-dependent methyltransferase
MEPEAYADMAAVEARHWWFRGRRAVLRAVIGRLGLPPGARILELGSGTGGNFETLAGFGAVTAVEMDAYAREISARKPVPVELHPGALPEAFDLGDQTFDLVCLFDVLEHVEDDAGTLRTLRRLLAPGGAAVITVPAHPKLFGPHDVALHHKRRYERAELERKLRTAGLRTETLTFINAALLPLAFLLRWLDKRFARRRASGTAIPPGPVNEVFAALFAAEGPLLGVTTLPFGLSLLAVVRAAD